MPRKKLSFEQSLSRLEEIAGLLEEQETGLEESMKLLQEGNKLALECETMLKTAKLTIEKDTGASEEQEEHDENL